MSPEREQPLKDEDWKEVCWGSRDSLCNHRHVPLWGKLAAIRPGATTSACGKTISAVKVTFSDLIWSSVFRIRSYMFWLRWYICAHWFQIGWPCCLFCTSARSNSSYKYTLYLGVASLRACLFNSNLCYWTSKLSIIIDLIAREEKTIHFIVQERTSVDFHSCVYP